LASASRSPAQLAQSDWRTDDPRYQLSTTLTTYLSNLGIQSQGLATLGQLDAYATYKLVELKTGSVLLTNSVHVANSFDLIPTNTRPLSAKTTLATGASQSSIRRSLPG